MTQSNSEYLQDVLETHNMKHIDNLVEKHRFKRDEIKELLENKYSTKIYTPFNSGSFKKHTAINSKFDLDLVVPFKKSSFTTISAMFDDVEKSLCDRYGKEAVRRQTVSFGIDFEDKEINIDVVPAREASKDKYEEDRDLNLHIEIPNKDYLKTNIHNQVEHIKGNENARKIIRLIKVWKSNHNKPYKSFFLELFAIKALNEKTPTGNLFEQLQTVLEYIRDKSTEEGFKLIDPGNSNNNLMETVATQKETLKSDIKILLQGINNLTNLKYYFPKNYEFDKSYGVSAGVSQAPSLPKSERFG